MAGKDAVGLWQLLCDQPEVCVCVCVCICVCVCVCDHAKHASTHKHITHAQISKQNKKATTLAMTPTPAPSVRAQTVHQIAVAYSLCALHIGSSPQVIPTGAHEEFNGEGKGTTETRPQNHRRHLGTHSGYNINQLEDSRIIFK